MKRNVIVAQSGGPSPVINASLQGVIEACRDYPDRFGEVYAGRHGVEGILQEELIDLGRQARVEIELLRKTPAAGAVGTCRYKLKEGQDEDFSRILEVFRAHDVGYFFYIGGFVDRSQGECPAAMACRSPLVPTYGRHREAHVQGNGGG